MMDKIIEALKKAKVSEPSHIIGREIINSMKHGVLLGQDSYSDHELLDTQHLLNNRIVAYDKMHPNSRSYDLLRTQVIQLMNQNQWQTLAITSPTPGCGKTVTAINLAFSISRQTAHDVILIDFDLIKPNISNYLGFVQKNSVYEYLNCEVELNEIISTPLAKNFFVLTNNKSIKNASEVVVLPRTKSLINGLKKLFPRGILIFDLPPMLASDDVIAFLPQIDCTLMVATSWKTTSLDIEKCASHLKQTNFLGFVLNQFEGKKEAYY